MTLHLELADVATVALECRVCGGETEPVLDLGAQGFARFVDSVAEEVPVAPLELDYCASCHAMQLRHSVHRERLFARYWYRSGINRTMREHLKGLAQDLKQRGDFKAILDIGSNDGTFLNEFEGIELVGFEPSDVADETTGDATVFKEFFNAEVLNGKRFGLITSIAMFYDLEEPDVFCQDVAECLEDDGIWCLEMNYLGDMVRNAAYDFVEHEHVVLYFLSTLNRVVRRNGLEVFDIERNEINGGSMRAFIGHRGKRPTSNSVDRFLANEAPLRGPQSIKRFRHKAVRNIETLRNWLQDAKRTGKSVYGYGASTRGSTTLQAIGADEALIQGIAELNPAKIGKLMGKTRIPIVSEADFRAAQPDYLLVLPWGFLPEFKEREKAYLEAGGKLIVPFPEPRIEGV